jgi:hypothetical protein
MNRAMVTLILLLMAPPVWARDWCGESFTSANLPEPQAGRMLNLCDAIAKMYGVEDVAYDSIGDLYIELLDPDNDFRRTADGVCNLRDTHDADLNASIVSVTEWFKLKSIDQLLELQDVHSFSCKGSSVGSAF